MSEIPRLDPNWVRRRRQEPESSFVPNWVGIFLVALALLWVGKKVIALDDAQQQAESRSRELVAMTAERNREAEILRRLAARAAAQPPASTTASTYTESPVSSGATGRAAEYDQRQVQANADARLQVEMQRWAQLNGQSSPSWSPPAPIVSARSRCEQAKAERDAAYRAVGNDRRHDFIRMWNDIVYEACKQT